MPSTFPLTGQKLRSAYLGPFSTTVFLLSVIVSTSLSLCLFYVTLQVCCNSQNIFQISLCYNLNEIIKQIHESAYISKQTQFNTYLNEQWLFRWDKQNAKKFEVINTSYAQGVISKENHLFHK